MTHWVLLWFSILLLLCRSTPVLQGQITTGNSTYSEEFLVEKESLISVKLGCFQNANDFTAAYIQNNDTKQIIVSISAQCVATEDELEDIDNFTWRSVLSDLEKTVVYRIVVKGAEGTFYKIRYTVNKTRLNFNGTNTFAISSPGSPSVHTFMLENWNQTSYRYLDVRVNSLENQSNIVGKMIVTQDKDELYNFFSSPNSSTQNSLRLSYSTFGNIVLSDVSKPRLAPGVWIIGHVLLNKNEEKNIEISISTNTDYEYTNNILIIVAVSCLGFIFPVFCRHIFDYLNDGEKRKFSLAGWKEVVVNWFYRGQKKLAYLTGFLAWLLLVSAFQVVHAKWGDMMVQGDRDICYYNERCYRPYLGYFDVSVNNIASNLPFMVHGCILILSVSLSETSCHLRGHKRYDYSIPYSFGLAFIFEGFGSLLYHICPSQIIFQFDTLFMFVISLYIITALVDGHAVRTHAYEDFSKILGLKRKSIRSPKLYLFVLGPAYGFNFLGNLNYISPLPPVIALFFFLFLGIWVISILLWAAYKADLLPSSCFPPPNLYAGDYVEVLVQADQVNGKNAKRSRLVIITVFGLYTVAAVAGFVLVVMDRLVISIYILGELILALFIMTAPSFVFLMRDLWNTLMRNAREQSNKYSSLYRCLIPTGIAVYLLLGLTLMVISLFFFEVLGDTNKSLPPWESRALNRDCILSNFWDTHDLWHFCASNTLMMLVLVVIEIQKPCRDCYLKYTQEISKYTKQQTQIKDFSVDEVRSELMSNDDDPEMRRPHETGITSRYNLDIGYIDLADSFS